MSRELVNIIFQPSGKSIEIEKGETLRNIIGSVGIDLRMPCGGKGTCGKCKVIFESGAPDPTSADKDMLSDAELLQGYRLACKATISQDAVVYVPNGNGIQTSKVLAIGTVRQVEPEPVITKKYAAIPEPSVNDLRPDFRRVCDVFCLGGEDRSPDILLLRPMAKILRESGFKVTGVFSNGRLIALEPGDTTSECYGVAFDIGTTTLAGYLIDLRTGRQLAVSSAMNPQARVGDDVISRISYTMQDEDGLEALRAAVVEELNKIVDSLLEGTGIRRDYVYEASIVGNTCMTHLFMGIDPRNLAVAPYVPVVSQGLYLNARDLGLSLNDNALAIILPCIAGYVGADTVGVILASDIYETEHITLAVDIGTNGEIVLGNKNRLLACSTAAGPAFEGAHIKHGMRAAPGAIDSVWLDEDQLMYGTVGNLAPIGICGSGLLDAVVCMLKAGIIEDNGRIVDPDEVPDQFGNLRMRIVDGERGNDFILVPDDETPLDEPIVITQRDVREVQLAKSAIAAGILTLMDELEVGTSDLESVILAGAFGNYVRKESAIDAGMLPNVSLSIVHSVGNAAGEGAKLALISSAIRKDMDEIGREVEYVELTTSIGFQEKFADALIFARIG